jgi:hypothetical protein
MHHYLCSGKDYTCMVIKIVNLLKFVESPTMGSTCRLVKVYLTKKTMLKTLVDTKIMLKNIYYSI